jgi:hypothetical protein
MPTPVCCAALERHRTRRKVLNGTPRLRALPRLGANRPRRRAVRPRRLPEDVLAMAAFDEALETIAGETAEE